MSSPEKKESKQEEEEERVNNPEKEEEKVNTTNEASTEEELKPKEEENNEIETSPKTEIETENKPIYIPKSTPNNNEGNESTEDEVDYEGEDDEDDHHHHHHPHPSSPTKTISSEKASPSTPTTQNRTPIVKNIEAVECKATRLSTSTLPPTPAKAGDESIITAWTNQSMATGRSSPSSVSTAPAYHPSKQQKHHEEEGLIEEENRPKKRVREEQQHVTLPSRGYEPTPPNATLPQQPRMEQMNVYIPPSKRRAMEQSQQQTNSTSTATPTYDIAYQRENWHTLKKTINGTINRLNTTTLKPLLSSLFSSANLIRGRGILAKTLLRAAMTSPSYSSVYAAFVAVINTKLPEVGELVLTRAILAFRRSFARKEKRQCVALCTLLGHLFNQGLTHELFVLQLLTILLDGGSTGIPTDDSVELAVAYMKIVGMALLESSRSGVYAIMERFRDLLHNGSIGKRVQYQVETLMRIRKEEFKSFPALPEELDLVEREDQITFELTLDEEDLNKEEILDVFRYDDEFEKNEEIWTKIKKEILGEEEDSGSEGGSSTDDGSSGTASDSDSEDDNDGGEDVPDQELALTTSISKSQSNTTIIQDFSESDLIHLRRTIYLTIMSSATFEECTHKLAKMSIPPGRELELINMLIECCSQERTFLRYYGLISSRFCHMHERWRTAFALSFEEQYTTIHRLETNKLRNVAKLFAHLLHTDSLSWDCLRCVKINEDDTTSSSRIFIKIVVQEMAEAMGMSTLKDRFEVATSSSGEDVASLMEQSKEDKWYSGMFPKDSARNTRYAINFFTSIGLGPLTDGLRLYLKNAPKLILAQAQAEAAAKARAAEDSDSSSTGSGSSSSTSSGSSSSSSVSSTSTSSYEYRRRRGRRSRRRSYSSSSSSSSSSGSSYSSYSDRRGRGRGRGRSRSSSRSQSRSSHHSVSPSPDKTKRNQEETTKNALAKNVEKKPSSPPRRRKSRSRSRSYSSDDSRRRRQTKNGRRRRRSVSSSSSSSSYSRNKNKRKKKRSITPPAVVVTKSPPRQEDEPNSKQDEMVNNKQEKDGSSRPKQRDRSASSSRSRSPPSKNGSRSKEHLKKDGSSSHHSKEKQEPLKRRDSRSPSSSRSRSSKNRGRARNGRKRRSSSSPSSRSFSSSNRSKSPPQRHERNDEKRGRRRRSPSYSSGSSRSLSRSSSRA